MGRRRKMNRFTKHECCVCETVFEAVRDDARYCSPKCRQQISRAVRAALAEGKKKPTVAALKIECADCGSSVTGKKGKCPVCGSRKLRPASLGRGEKAAAGK